MATRIKAPTLADRIFGYLEKNGSGTNTQIAAAIKTTSNNVSARTGQMVDAGSLDRTGPEPQGPFTYTIKNREARTSKPPRRLRRSRRPAPLTPLPGGNPFAQAVMSLAEVLADQIIAQVGRAIALKVAGMMTSTSTTSVIESRAAH